MQSLQTASLIVRKGAGAACGQAAKVKNQKAVQELPQLLLLCRRELEV